MSGATDQLLRLLRILPLAGRKDGLSYDEAAAICSTSSEQIQKDLQVLTGRSEYLPAGRSDDVQIIMDADRIRIFSPGGFGRPIRLTQDEQLAVALALRCRGLSDEDRAELCAEIERSLAFSQRQSANGTSVTSPPDVPMEFVSGRPDPEGMEACFTRGVVERRRVQFGYVKSHGAAPEVRTLEPVRTVHAEGEIYVVGFDVDRQKYRLFRVDRVLGCKLLETTFEPDPDFDVESMIRDGRVLLRTDDEEYELAEVRYSSRVSRWVRERYSGDDGDEGSYTVRHELFSQEWLVRHVLQFGPDAEVLSPPAVRERVREALNGAGKPGA